MKKLAFLTALMLIGMNAFSQAVTELRPFWVKQVPQIPVGANYFVNWGVGEGRTESEATNMAWADALQKSLHELGVVGITAQDINAVAMNGINAVVKFNRMKRRIVTSTEPIVLSANRVKIYILIQVQRNVNGPDDFYSLNTANFKDTSFNKKMKGYNAQLTGRYPFSARVFVPGMAQLHKGSMGKGLFFIISEAACVGGIVATECMRASYDSKIKSTHDAGKAAKKRMDEITVSIAGLMGAAPEEIIYTSCASESNNTALKGIAALARSRGMHIISTALEHSSVGGCLTALQEQGFEVDLVDIDRNGKIDLEHLRELLRRDTILVSVCLVDSELGTIQPVSEIAEILRDYPDCRLHVDATQAMGKIPVCLDGIDTLSFTLHKFYGLNGSGILYKKKDLILEPLIHGGHSTTIYRSGTPALSLAAAAKYALSDAISHQKERYETVSGYNRFLREELSKIPGVSINSPEDAVPHILNVSVKGIRGTRMQQALNEKGICVSVKSACAVEGTPSKAVYAVCRDRNRAMNSFRISLSHLTTKKELDTFLQVFLECCKERE